MRPVCPRWIYSISTYLCTTPAVFFRVVEFAALEASTTWDEIPTVLSRWGISFAEWRLDEPCPASFADRTALFVKTGPPFYDFFLRFEGPLRRSVPVYLFLFPIISTYEKPDES